MLRELIKEIRPAPRFDYVIGHQDRASTNLSEWENMSTAADIKAKLAFWEATQENETFQSKFLDVEFLSPVAVQAGDRKRHILSNLRRSLEGIASGEAARHCWAGERGLKEYENLIDWEAH